MSQIDLSVTMQSDSTAEAGVQRSIGLSVAITIPVHEGWGPVTNRHPKQRLVIDDSKVTISKSLEIKT